MTRISLTLILGLLVASPVFAGGPVPGKVKTHAAKDSKTAARHMKKDAKQAWANPNPKAAHRGMVKNSKQAHRHLVKQAQRAGVANTKQARRANRIATRDAKRANRHVKKQFGKAKSGNATKGQIDRAIRRDGRRADKRFKTYGQKTGLNKSKRVRTRYKRSKRATKRGYRKARRRAR
jgi:hypothetical protein